MLCSFYKANVIFGSSIGDNIHNEQKDASTLPWAAQSIFGVLYSVLDATSEW